MLNCTVVPQPIATTTSSCNRLVVHTPQRKAKYSDKTRVRLAVVKANALRNCKCRDTVQMKERLGVLGIKLDLRLTSAWVAIAWELQPLIEKLAVLPFPTANAFGGTGHVVSGGSAQQPKLPTKKALAPVSLSEPPVFLSEKEAMNYYLNKYGWG